MKKKVTTLGRQLSINEKKQVRGAYTDDICCKKPRLVVCECKDDNDFNRIQ